MEQIRPETLEILWRFIRGDMPVPLFEKWAYQNTSIEGVLGADLYFELISTPFSSPDAVEGITRLLQEFAERVDSSQCRCVRVAQVAVIDMWDEGVFRTFELERERGEPYWWLSMYRCNVCGQAWLVAQEERQNDVFCLRRLVVEERDRLLQKNGWPNDFDQYESLLTLGAAAGHSVRFVDPLCSSLCWTVLDLAKERPGIRVTELAALLNLDLQLAEQLAQQAVKTSAAQINFD